MYSSFVSCCISLCGACLPLQAIDEEEGVDLCDCEFSLAYGAKILLNNTRLRLKKGRRYGLCGPNGAGKVRAALLLGPGGIYTTGSAVPCKIVQVRCTLGSSLCIPLLQRLIASSCWMPCDLVFGNHGSTFLCQDC